MDIPMWVENMLDYVHFGRFMDMSEVQTEVNEGPTTTPSEHTSFEQLLEDARRPLYPGC